MLQGGCNGTDAEHCFECKTGWIKANHVVVSAEDAEDGVEKTVRKCVQLPKPPPTTEASAEDEDKGDDKDVDDFMFKGRI